MELMAALNISTMPEIKKWHSGYKNVFTNLFIHTQSGKVICRLGKCNNNVVSK